MANIIFIYSLVNKKDNETFYVGKTLDMEKTFAEHLRVFYNKPTLKDQFIFYIRRSNVAMFRVEVIEGKTAKEAHDRYREIALELTGTVHGERRSYMRGIVNQSTKPKINKRHSKTGIMNAYSIIIKRKLEKKEPIIFSIKMLKEKGIKEKDFWNFYNNIYEK